MCHRSVPAHLYHKPNWHFQLGSADYGADAGAGAHWYFSHQLYHVPFGFCILGWIIVQCGGRLWFQRALRGHCQFLVSAVEQRLDQPLQLARWHERIFHVLDWAEYQWRSSRGTVDVLAHTEPSTRVQYARVHCQLRRFGERVLHSSKLCHVAEPSEREHWSVLSGQLYQGWRVECGIRQSSVP